MKAIRVAIGFLAATVAAAGCGGDNGNGNGTGPNGPVDMGDFSGNVTGDLEFTFTGNAVFGNRTDDEGKRFWVLFLSSGNINSTEFDIVSFFRENTARPNTATVTIHDASVDPPTLNDFLGFYFVSRTVGTWGHFLSESGTLTIEASSASQVSGSYTFIARGGVVNPPGPDSLLVEGTFRAVPGQIPEPGQPSG